MEKEFVRPQQKRSIEKRKKIMDAGYLLFSEQGYFNTNTAEIAKAAGVSTGIVYRYFPDKKAIFLEVMQDFMDIFYENLMTQFSAFKPSTDLRKFFETILQAAISIHTMSSSFFREIESMAHYDNEIAEFFDKIEEDFTNKLIELLPSWGIVTSNPHEKIHFVFTMIESYAHEMLYNKHSCKDYEALKELLIETCIFIAKKEVSPGTN